MPPSQVILTDGTSFTGKIVDRAEMAKDDESKDLIISAAPDVFMMYTAFGELISFDRSLVLFIMFFN